MKTASTKQSQDGRPREVSGNRILDALPSDVREQVFGQLTPMSLKSRTVVFHSRQVLTHVHFPVSGVISLVTPFDDGSSVEVATIGNEGIVGVPLIEGGSLAVRAIARVAGTTLRMTSATFLAELGKGGLLAVLVQNYTQALFGQISQAAACNRLHSNEQRLSRWLLMSHDRVGTDVFHITHESIGQTLGSRRQTVSLSMGLLQAAELIRYRRGRVTILDRLGLEKVSCECYAVIREVLERA